MTERRHFIPAAGHDWLLPFYDPIQILMGGNSFRRSMIDEARIQPGQRALDIGCGTGSLIVQLLRLQPEADVTGLDPDPKALARAKPLAEDGYYGIQSTHETVGSHVAPHRHRAGVFAAARGPAFRY